ncbi:MAG: hypothetical protein EHM24_21055 [Acidobacteria bacterium]|nr:MAG: hypothetical protein EHM24_21055 [Acidobacteriota bacterium]
MQFKRSLSAALFAAAALAAATTPATAQSRDSLGRLVVTVADQTQAVLPDATVIVTAQREGAPVAPMTATTSKIGAAVFENLEQGRYTIQAEFQGFEPATIRDVRVRAGDNRRTVILQLPRRDEEVTVARDKQSSAMDPKGSAFSTILTREQIEALPDDPDEMEAVLKAMSPPGSTIRVDGFTGGRLPPKAQIRSIRLPRLDTFAAQNHGGMGGALFIDIMTMPGAGPMRGSIDFNFLDDAFNARNAMTRQKGDEQLKQYGLSLSGTIKPNKTSFSLNAGGASQYFSSNLLAVLPNNIVLARALPQPQDRLNFSGRLDHALNAQHAVRLSFDRASAEMENQGVGEYNLPERAYSTESSTNMLRISENGPLGRRFFSESRLQLRWTDNEARSESEERTIRVNDAFAGGGAQMRGGRSDITFELASDLDYVRGAHSWRTGVMFEGGRYTSNDTSNYLGTYTFSSLADYEAGKPSVFTMRIGDPDVRYSYLQAAGYVQDDWRIARSLLLSGGVRYGYLTFVDDGVNLSPRFSLAWSPLKSGNLTVRGNYGYFYDWIAGDTYKQTLLVDGVRQRELNVRNPSYPEPGLIGTAPASNKYLWSQDLLLPNAHRASVGVDRALTPNMRVSASYHASWGRNLLRPRNLNAPVDGVRPDANYANVVQLVSDADSTQQMLSLGWNLSLFNKRRTFVFANYTFGNARTNTGGPFSLLANGDDLEAEWGPTGGDARHRLSASFNTQPIRDLSVMINTSWRSATPYNITTGGDDNGDGVFNDRPDGVGRNSARGSGQFDLGGRLSYAIGIGKRAAAAGAGGGGATQVVMVGGGGGAMAAGFGGGAADARFRIEFYISGQNLLNVTNHMGYSGVKTSPLFGHPAAAGMARRLQVGMRFGF